MPGPDIGEVDTNRVGKTVSGTALGASVVEGVTGAVSDGLAVAGRVAGDVLSGIFGGLPWAMDPSSIVDAVAGGAGVLVEVVGVLG